MNNKEIMKQMINFQKESLENCFSMMVTLQLQAENIFNFFHYLPIMSDEGKKFMKQRTDAYKKWIDDLKKIMDDGYSRVEVFCDSNKMMMFRDHTEKMYDFYLNQAKWIPQDVKKTMEELDATYKKGCDEFKKYVDEYIRSLKNLYNTTHTSQTETKL
jgi:hypothetical protein